MSRPNTCATTTRIRAVKYLLGRREGGLWVGEAPWGEGGGGGVNASATRRRCGRCGARRCGAVGANGCIQHGCAHPATHIAQATAPPTLVGHKQAARAHRPLPVRAPAPRPRASAAASPRERARGGHPCGIPAGGAVQPDHYQPGAVPAGPDARSTAHHHAPGRAGATPLPTLPHHPPQPRSGPSAHPQLSPETRARRAVNLRHPPPHPTLYGGLRQCARAWPSSSDTGWRGCSTIQSTSGRGREYGSHSGGFRHSAARLWIILIFVAAYCQIAP